MPPAGWPFERASEDEEPPGDIWWTQTVPMAPQFYSWTCSVCSLDWVLQAAGLAAASDRYGVGQQIGYPENVNGTYGLMDATGSELQAVLNDYGQSSESARLGFDQVYARVQETTGCMSGGAWYHWVALRGTDDDALWIANSAPGYKGVYDRLSRADFERLGPFNVVLLT